LGTKDGLADARPGLEDPDDGLQRFKFRLLVLAVQRRLLISNRLTDSDGPRRGEERG
jgi:hypothetical protein